MIDEKTIIQALLRNRGASKSLACDEEIYEIANCLVECLNGFKIIKKLGDNLIRSSNEQEMFETLIEIANELGHIDNHIRTPKYFFNYVNAMES